MSDSAQERREREARRKDAERRRRLADEKAASQSREAHARRAERLAMWCRAGEMERVESALASDVSARSRRAPGVALPASSLGAALASACACADPVKARAMVRALRRAGAAMDASSWEAAMIAAARRGDAKMLGDLDGMGAPWADVDFRGRWGRPEAAAWLIARGALSPATDVAAARAAALWERASLGGVEAGLEKKPPRL